MTGVGWRGRVSAHPLLAFTVLTYGVTWTAWLGVVAVGGPVWELAGTMALFSPALGCLLVTRAIDPSRRVTPGRTRWLAFTAAWLISTAVLTAYVAMTSGSVEPVAVLVFAIVGLLPATVVASAWSSSLVVRQALQTLIHLPFHYSGHWNADPTSFQVALVGTFFSRFLFTWLFLRTGGGLWSAILFHTSANVAFALLPATWTAIALFGLLAVTAIISGRMWKQVGRTAPGRV